MLRIADAAHLLGAALDEDIERDSHAAMVREHGLQELCWVLFNASEFLYVR